MIEEISTSQLFADLVDDIEIECEEQGIDHLLEVVEEKVKRHFIDKEIDEIDLNVFMYQIAFAVTMRYRAKKGV